MHGVIRGWCYKLIESPFEENEGNIIMENNTIAKTGALEYPRRSANLGRK